MSEQRQSNPKLGQMVFGDLCLFRSKIYNKFICLYLFTNRMSEQRQSSTIIGQMILGDLRELGEMVLGDLSLFRSKI